jgi:hypothetical protein
MNFEGSGAGSMQYQCRRSRGVSETSRTSGAPSLSASADEQDVKLVVGRCGSWFRMPGRLRGEHDEGQRFPPVTGAWVQPRSTTTKPATSWFPIM